MILSLGSISTVAQTIQKVEGYYPGSLAYRNNNPGNLKFANQSGATGVDSRGFAIFPDYQTGYDALRNQIRLDASRGLTIQQFINKYAPASDKNNPVAYAQSIATAAGLNTSDPLSLALADGTTTQTDIWEQDYTDTQDSTDTVDTATPLIVAGIGLVGAWLIWG